MAGNLSESAFKPWRTKAECGDGKSSWRIAAARRRARGFAASSPKFSSSPRRVGPRFRPYAAWRSPRLAVACWRSSKIIAWLKPGWSEAIARAHRAGHKAVGGSVENGSVLRTIDWAVYFCEYANFMGPVPDGVAAIPGNNSAYDREALLSLEPKAYSEQWESFWQGLLREQGVTFISDPTMVVLHKKHFATDIFCRNDTTIRDRSRACECVKRRGGNEACTPRRRYCCRRSFSAGSRRSLSKSGEISRHMCGAFR